MMESAAQSLMCSSTLCERDPLDYVLRLLDATQSSARIRQQSASLRHELNAGVNDPLATRSAGTVAALHPDKATHGNQEEKSH